MDISLEDSRLENSQVIIILGMHRSGTSILSRGLKAMGVHLGDDLLGANSSNPTGHWENQKILEINDRIFEIIGSSWQHVSPISERFMENPAITGMAEEATAYLKANFGGRPLWGFKDPRTIRLLPFWEKVLRDNQVSVKYIYSIRNPRSVVRSLNERDNLSEKVGYLLWLAYTIPYFKRVSENEMVVVDYDLFMESPLQGLLRIAERLHLTIKPYFGEMELYSKEFIDKSLRHSTFTLEIPPEIDQLEAMSLNGYALLISWAVEGEGRPEEFWPQWESLAASYGKFASLTQMLQDQRDLIEYAREELSYLDQVRRMVREWSAWPFLKKVFKPWREPKRKRNSSEADYLARARVLNHNFVLSKDETRSSELQIAGDYLLRWKIDRRNRKPFPGFHPGIYREQNGLIPSGIDPLIHFLKRARPVGPWSYQVITPENPIQNGAAAKIALQLHIYHMEMLEPILTSLRWNQKTIDLLITTDCPQKKKSILSALKSYHNGRVELRVIPNRGRDIGAFCSGFEPSVYAQYDLLGHIHTKKSPHLKLAEGRRWLDFILKNLLGGKERMADRVLSTMEADPTIGIAFPDDPIVRSWDRNRGIADDLAGRMGLAMLPTQVNFPVGSMFWARVPALAPLLRLGLTWEDYPKEPSPLDGTILHAIERLFPLVVAFTNHRVAVTYHPNAKR